MGVEFRQRSAGEIIQIVKRSKWHIMLPTFAVAAAVAWVVWSLPNFYDSTTFLTLKPPTISEKVVQSLSSEDLSQRLQNINQTVLSRSSLEPMVAKYKLFEMEKASGMPMELLIDKMRKNIKVEPERTDTEKVAGFRITYRDRSPEAARNVTAELASKYVNAQIIESTQSAETTREFIENQVAQAKAKNSVSI
jgi:polysaccharide biosynthesis transport protein